MIQNTDLLDKYQRKHRSSLAYIFIQSCQFSYNYHDYACAKAKML